MKSKILIVEDEMIEAMAFQYHLESFGYDVVGIVTNGDGAIQKAVEVKLDLILMDINLKGDLNGIETARKINDERNTPVVYLTGSHRNLNLEELTSSAGFLTKPVNKIKLKKHHRSRA
ncbi:MAG: response regulator [Methanothermobacter sp.]